MQSACCLTLIIVISIQASQLILVIRMIVNKTHHHDTSLIGILDIDRPSLVGFVDVDVDVEFFWS
jgi:hypothetical protein